LGLCDLILRVAYLATISESRGNAQLGQNIRLQQKPHGEYYQNPPTTHSILLIDWLRLKRMLILTPKATCAAHGCLNQPAQENPLEGEAQPDENPPLKPLSDEPHEKEDICLHVSFSPQEGQTGFISPSEGKTSCSNTFSHLLHLNS